MVTVLEGRDLGKVMKEFSCPFHFVKMQGEVYNPGKGPHLTMLTP